MHRIKNYVFKFCLYDNQIFAPASGHYFIFAKILLITKTWIQDIVLSKKLVKSFKSSVLLSKWGSDFFIIKF